MSASCPICLRSYSQLSQHLRVFHRVVNVKERKLLLALESGRVKFREGKCTIPGCEKTTTRLDCHIKTHIELSKADQRNAIKLFKRRVILEELAALRASNPTVPTASSLDLTETDDPLPLEDVEMYEEEEESCQNPSCQRSRNEVADLHKQVDTLSSALRDVSRRYRLLKRKFKPSPSSQLAKVTRKLMSALESTGPEEGTLSPQPEAEHAAEPPSSPEASTSQAVPEKEAFPPFPDHVAVLNEILEEYRRHHEGSDPGPKLQNDVASKIYRIRNFIGYMAEGKTNLSSLIFLKETNRIRSWHNSLRQAKITEPTIHHYLKNVSQFLEYLAETPPATNRLSKAVLVGIRRELRSLIKSARRKVMVHQVSVKTAKEGKLIPKSVLLKCRSMARKAIPEILARLKESPTPKDQWSFYGHMTAYLASMFGHRGGVYQNMTIDEVEGARISTAEDSYLNISAHKTNQQFGAAQLSLTGEEYGWMKDFLSMRSELSGGAQASFFFFTSKPSFCRNLNAYFQEAWKSMGLHGTPTFTDIRTAIATHARNTHTPDDRQKVAQFMCHDTSTADRFYAVNLDAKLAKEHRKLFESALFGPESSPVKATSPTKRKSERPVPGRQSKRARAVAKSSGSKRQERSPEESEDESPESSPKDPQPSTPRRSDISSRLRPVVRLLPLVLSPKSPAGHQRAQRLVSLAKKRLCKSRKPF